MRTATPAYEPIVDERWLGHETRSWKPPWEARHVRCSLSSGRLPSKTLGVGAARIWSNDVAGRTYWASAELAEHRLTTTETASQAGSVLSTRKTRLSG
jgi:hypothetical protein